ncbi:MULTISPECIES: hypothetical protein [Halorubrum]|jgi:hypothetical protein|uniref:Uncharacterized protein n=1 Tax=Halorubrum ezzemoulense TaxID=337243 RepID=A0A256JX79_HALEZ|nr:MULTISPECIES: hypothetical protein [Halorubrum]OYR58671.1 hypothetical protein DJ83_14645 [Halorubrum ezzemoulense]OYR73504.1 hypothetical protein DJ78_00160 [Halorubrum ezzemoulense]OYR78516.1 hypothetical protein DJ84_20985 [Halorubrum ezzemoulense]PHQ41567.1 hypothetical protein Z052_14005 [Halorubrum sp. C191]QAY21786.1 hypothetical protein EO776_17790 [Halorubrum ezzemoulense]
MSGNKLLIAASATVIWVISGVLLFEVASLASAFELAVSGPILDLTSLLDAWLLAGAILGVVDVALLWDMATGW